MCVNALGETLGRFFFLRLDVIPILCKRIDEVLDFCSGLAEVLHDAADFQITEPDTQRTKQPLTSHSK